MKRKLLIALTVAVILVLALIVGQSLSEKDATYQGLDARAWAEALQSNSDSKSNNLAVVAFQVLGSNAVPTLQNLLNAREPWYAKLFAKQGSQLPRSARTFLAQRIKPGRTVVNRIAAARALGLIGTNAAAAVPDLIAKLNDVDVRWAAAQALAKIGGPAIPALAAATTNADFNIRHAAVYGLGQAGTNAWPATDALLVRVLDNHPSVRASAVYSLGQVGPPGVPIVIAGFSSADSQRREAATAAIRAMNTPPRQVVRTLLEYSTNSSPAVRQNSLEALQSLRSNHPRVVVNYFEATTDPDVGVRATAARALAQAHTWSTNTFFSNTIVRLLKSDENLDSNVVATLTRMLADPEPPVRDAARQSLASLHPVSPK